MNRDITKLYLEQVCMQPTASRQEIAKNILQLITICETTDASYVETLRKIKAEAKKLV